MIRRSLAAVLSLALVAFAVPSTAIAAPPDKAPSGFTFPINAASDTAGTFSGTLRIVGFSVQNGKLIASGLVTGTLTDPDGGMTWISRTVALPVATTANATAAPLATCDILHLNLGPLHLDLLGLVIDLNRVVLDIVAESGAGNLLGNLLCAITNLLNGGGPLTTIANLLNQLLSILT